MLAAVAAAALAVAASATTYSVDPSASVMKLHLHHKMHPVDARSSKIEGKAVLADDGKVGEDDVRRAEKHLEDVTHKYVAQIDELLKHKEAELLEV